MTTPLKFWSFQEICASAERHESERLARRDWGRWHLDLSTLELIYKKDMAGYYIDLERMNTSAALLDWIFQVHNKNWSTNSDIGDLIAALQDIFHPQGTLCSFGCVGGANFGKQLDATDYLRRRYRIDK